MLFLSLTSRKFVTIGVKQMECGDAIFMAIIIEGKQEDIEKGVLIAQSLLKK